MIRLTLVRHAKAEWKSSHTGDFDRALTHRGQAEAQTLARHLSGRELVPDLLMTSTARRAKQTAEALAREFELSAHIVKQEERLYLAVPADILVVVRSVGPKVAHLMIVGHNPGISELAKLLAPQCGLAELGTAAACTMTFDEDEWSNVALGEAATASCESGTRRLFGWM